MGTEERFGAARRLRWARSSGGATPSNIRQSVVVAKRADNGEQKAAFSNADFDTLSWHDCHIHGIELRTGDPEEGDWNHDLALDIDFIVDGWRRPDEKWAFLVAPAWLVFSAVTGLRIAIEWKTEGGGNEVLHPASISRIVRRQVDPPSHRQQPLYEWTVELNWPHGGTIAFCASSFELQVRADAVETGARQHLSTEQRRRI